MKKNLIAFGMLATITISSCCSIIHGTKQEVSISSYPSAAKVTIDGNNIGATPITTKLSRKDNHTVEIILDGYLPYETKFTRHVDGWIAGNIIFGGLIGLAVDAINGAMYKLTPEQIDAQLKSNSTTVTKTKTGLFFAVVLKPDNHWQKIGQLVKK